MGEHAIYDWRHECDFVDHDEVWVEEWARFGMAEMSAYLAKQLAFARYCDARES